MDDMFLIFSNCFESNGYSSDLGIIAYNIKCEF